jgi:hypothetical protein
MLRAALWSLDFFVGLMKRCYGMLQLICTERVKHYSGIHSLILLLLTLSGVAPGKGSDIVFFQIRHPRQKLCLF